MTGRNVNIYFQEETCNKIKDLIGQRKISKFINEAAEEKLVQEHRKTINYRLPRCCLGLRTK